MAWLKRVEKPRLARLTDVNVERRAFERSARLFRTPPYTTYLRDKINGVPGSWVWCKPKRPDVLIYIHGGAHCVGSARTHRALVARICEMTGLRAFLPDYRLSPEHPFPSSLTDALDTWAGLRSRGNAAHQLFVGGDSSGGGLALSLLSSLLEMGERPAAAFAFSPWTDLTLSGKSFAENVLSDSLLPTSQAERVRRDFLQGEDPEDPRASPLFASFPNAPPLFFQVARTEILRDDTLRLAERLRTEGTDVTLDLWEDAPHVWPIFQGWVPESDEALQRLADFIAQQHPAPRTVEN